MSSTGPASCEFRDIPSDWSDTADFILRGEKRVILVVGPKDSGKSTFCRLLVSGARRASRSAWLLDADLGQKMVGPPACVTLGQGGDDASIGLLRLVFVGTTDPVRGWPDLMRGVLLLAADPRPDLLIVNTGGLLAGPGLRLKAAKIEALSPDLIVGIGDGPDLDAVLARPNSAVVWLPSSPFARPKTEGERRAARRAAFRSYFADASRRSVSLADLEVRDADEIGPIPPDGLLFGFGNRSGADAGLGVVTAVCPDGSLFECLGPAEIVSASWIRWGTLKLREDFTDEPL